MMNDKGFMIIDDDADDRMFLREALNGMLYYYVCLEANDGVEALKQLRKAKQLPDFIFLDVNMPRMDGRDCLRELKKDTTLANIPVIMYSTSFTEKSIAEFLTLGASGYLNKPMNISKLPEQILLAIKQSIPV
jgi:CheY-like chemotaxis protein